MKIDVHVPAGASGSLESSAAITGGNGGSADDSISTPVTPTGVPVPYGASAVTDLARTAGGVDTQAGSHPYAFTTLMAYNSNLLSGENCSLGLVATANTAGCAARVGEAKDVEVELPAGFIGNVTAVPRCTQQDFQSGAEGACPAVSQVGLMVLSFYGNRADAGYTIPVYDIAPPAGVPAELGFTLSTLGRVAMVFHVRRIPGGGGYAITAVTPQITQFLQLRSLALTIWGVPGDESHRSLRRSERECVAGYAGREGNCKYYGKVAPFLTLPTSCSGQPLSVAFGVDSWQEPVDGPLSMSLRTSMAGMEGCEALSFEKPAIAIDSDSGVQGQPSGYHVHLIVPQSEDPEALLEPAVRDVTVAMPQGTTVSPSAANGLTACSDVQFALEKEGAGACPLSSKIGSVKIFSPLVEVPLGGSVYLGEPECSPCTPQQTAEGKMVKLLIEARLPEPLPLSSNPPVLIKLAGHARIDQSTGQVVAVFEENPQLPFDELEMSLKNGQDAPLVNPDVCGNITASAKLTGWSGAVAEISSPPQAIEGCVPQAFTPALEAGMTGTARGGAFSGFAVTLSRPLGQQSLGQVTVHMPPGLVGMLSSVPLCAEAQANAGTCPAASQLGTTSVIVGPGTLPYSIEGGKVFLTEKYGGAPFGLSIVTPAKAGPFQLAGNAGNGDQVVRAGIEIDPRTAAVTIKTDQLPTALNGIPIGIDKVIVNVDRPNFMFNPTDCEAMSIDATIDSSAGAAANVSSPFQASNCGTLPFTPVFKATTKAHHTRRDGAYLQVIVESKAGQANIHEVHVELPKVLPTRSSTLNHACLVKVFEENPAKCPVESQVGYAKAVTPVLPVPLTGPAYFVSYGGQKFPELVIVLQGDGVTVDLHGETFVNGKTNVIASTYKSVPDVPVSRFELTLPEREYSALGANANLCRAGKTVTVTRRVRRKVHGHMRTVKVKVKKKIAALSMPTTLIGQNGAEIHRSTTIAVAGCAKAKGRKRAAAHKEKKKPGRRKAGK
jgi:hypothetical protein